MRLTSRFTMRASALLLTEQHKRREAGRDKLVTTAERMADSTVEELEQLLPGPDQPQRP